MNQAKELLEFVISALEAEADCERTEFNYIYSFAVRTKCCIQNYSSSGSATISRSAEQIYEQLSHTTKRGRLAMRVASRSPRDSYALLHRGIGTILMPSLSEELLDMTTALIVGVPGGIELLVILAIVILLFGANKLPGLARSSGEAIGEFKKGREQIEREIRAAAEGPAETDEDASESESA